MSRLLCTWHTYTLNSHIPRKSVSVWWSQQVMSKLQQTPFTPTQQIHATSVYCSSYLQPFYLNSSSAESDKQPLVFSSSLTKIIKTLHSYPRTRLCVLSSCLIRCISLPMLALALIDFACSQWALQTHYSSFYRRLRGLSLQVQRAVIWIHELSLHLLHQFWL